MLAVNMEFKVRVNSLLEKDEQVFVCGSHPELGNWFPIQAKVLKREEFSKYHNYEIWSISVCLPLKNFQYRYFIGKSDANYESYDEKSLMISSWESNINPRQRNIYDDIRNTNGTVIENSLDIYGFIDDHCRLLHGWLLDQTAVQIRIYGSAVKLYKTRNKEKKLFISCYHFPIRKDNWHNDDEDESLCDHANRRVAKFSKLNKEDYIPKMPPVNGVEFNEDDYLTFHFETMDLEDTGVEIEIRQLARDVSLGSTPTSSVIDINSVEFQRQKRDQLTLDEDYVVTGIARLGQMTAEKTIKSIVLYNSVNRQIGEIKVDCISVTPLMGYRYSMERTFMLHWKHRKTVKVGHKGSGTSYGHETKVSAVRENTIHSLRNASEHGADYVEFDVQLSKDLVPVVYHDFQVCTVLRKKRKNEMQYLEIPVKDLKLSDLQALKLDHTSVLTFNDLDERMNMEDIDPSDLQPFPTLENCLDSVPISVGFNIELKYPQSLLSGLLEQDNYFERNLFLDCILKVMFEHAKERRIIFSSFDADICMMLSLKQNIYPIMFLTQADTNVYEMYKDIRTQSLETALYFAKNIHTLGICAFAPVAMDNLRIVSQILENKLILFVWGEYNNDSEVQKNWRMLGVHGIIFDRIHEFQAEESSSKICFLQEMV